MLRYSTAPTHFSPEQELEDMSAQRQGHDLCVQQTESDEATNVPVGIQPLWCVD